jgi:hypothetical protein
MAGARGGAMARGGGVVPGSARRYSEDAGGGLLSSGVLARLARMGAGAAPPGTGGTGRTATIACSALNTSPH